jgi:hypothetical protein
MARSATTDGSETSPFQAGVVLRRELFERLSGAGRVTEVSAPAGSGKTYLLRSWIREAGHLPTPKRVAAFPSLPPAVGGGALRG